MNERDMRGARVREYGAATVARLGTQKGEIVNALAAILAIAMDRPKAGCNEIDGLGYAVALALAHEVLTARIAPLVGMDPDAMRKEVFALGRIVAQESQ